MFRLILRWARTYCFGATLNAVCLAVFCSPECKHRAYDAAAAVVFLLVRLKTEDGSACTAPPGQKKRTAPLRTLPPYQLLPRRRTKPPVSPSSSQPTCSSSPSQRRVHAALSNPSACIASLT